MSELTEKLGIKPILMYEGGGGYYVDGEQVRKLEQHNADMLEVLIDLMKGVEGLPPLTAIQGILTRQWLGCEDVLQKTDPQHRSWQEIKQLIGE